MSISSDLKERIATSREQAKLLFVGQKIRTSYIQREKDVGRTILSIMEAPHDFGSGRGVTLSGGESCSQCGKTAGTPIATYIDASWCQPEAT